MRALCIICEVFGAIVDIKNVIHLTATLSDVAKAQILSMKAIIYVNGSVIERKYRLQCLPLALCLARSTLSQGISSTALSSS
jgi:hypothetical protein